MSKKIAVAGIGLLILLVAVWVRPAASQGSSKATAATGEEFRGKYLAVAIRAGEQSGRTQLLKGVEIKTIGGRTFLAGETPVELGEGKSPWEGVQIWIPVDEVMSIHVMKDVQQVRAVIPTPAQRAQVPK